MILSHNKHVRKTRPPTQSKLGYPYDAFAKPEPLESAARTGPIIDLNQTLEDFTKKCKKRCRTKSIRKIEHKFWRPDPNIKGKCSGYAMGFGMGRRRWDAYCVVSFLQSNHWEASVCEGLRHVHIMEWTICLPEEQILGDIRAQSWITPAPTVQQMAINSLSPFKPSFHNSAFTVWNKRSVSHIVVWSQCKGELGALSRVLASVKTSLWSFLHLPIFWIESEPGVVGPESRKLGAPGVSSASESSSSVRSFSALEVGRILLALGVVWSSVGSGESWGLPSCVGVFCCGGGVYPFHPWLIWACRFQVWGGRLQHLLLHLCFILFCSCKGFCEAIDDDGSYADRYASHVFLSLFKSNDMCYSVVNTSFHDKEDRYMYYESLTLNDEFFLLGDRSPSLSSTLFIHLTQTLPYINNPEKNE